MTYSYIFHVLLFKTNLKLLLISGSTDGDRGSGIVSIVLESILLSDSNQPTSRKQLFK